MFLKLIILSVFIISLSLFGLAVRMIFHRSRKFAATSIGKNPEMKKIGITCPKHDEILCVKGGSRSCAC